MWVTSNQTRCVFNIYPTPQNAPNTWELERPIGKLPGPSNQHASICNYNLAVWNVHLSSSEKIALHTYFLRNNTKRWQAKFCCGNYNECAKKIRLYIFKYRSLATAGLVRVHTKPKSLSHSNQTKFQGVYGQSSFPWTAESKCFYAIRLVFVSSNGNECRKWMRST